MKKQTQFEQSVATKRSNSHIKKHCQYHAEYFYNCSACRYANLPTISRPPAINDAIDILSSCYHELESLGHFSLCWWNPICEGCNGLKALDHAMAYLEREYTSVRPLRDVGA